MRNEPPPPSLFVTAPMRRWYEDGCPRTMAATTAMNDLMLKEIDESRRSDGSNRVRPSMIGKCVRAQALSFLGMPSLPPTRGLQALFMNGHYGHYRWQLAGLSSGFLTAVEVPVADNNLKIVGAMDGVCSDGSVFELKTTSNASFYRVAKNGPYDSHISQVNAYMYASGVSLASLVYENRDTMDFKEFRLTFDEQRFSKVMHTCTAVASSTQDTLPQPLRDCVMHVGSTYKSCFFRKVCRPEGGLDEQ
jgi:hypothetical protein